MKVRGKGIGIVCQQISFTRGIKAPPPLPTPKTARCRITIRHNRYGLDWSRAVQSLVAMGTALRLSCAIR